MKLKLILFFYPLLILLMCKSNYIDRNDNTDFQKKIVNKNDTVFWCDSVKLSWDDFQGHINYNSEYYALTSAGFVIKYKSYTTDEATISLRSYFNKSKSWAIKDSVDEYVLRHELFHFHITELALRKFKKKLCSWKVNQNEFNANFNDLTKGAFSDREMLHHLYDKETNHSIDSIMQKRWEKNIVDSLNAYSEYAKSEVSIKFTN